MWLKGTDLIHLGYPQGKVLGLALDIVRQRYAHFDKNEKLLLLKKVLANPGAFMSDPHIGPVATELLHPAQASRELNKQVINYHTYGAEGIEAGALQQMETAMRLPVTVAGALMPDAHQGYGLPIGGVLATKNSVIPYAVGVDIGCRMSMSIYDLPSDIVVERRDLFKKMLVDNTQFGLATFKKPKDHAIFERSEFSEIRIIREMKDRASLQIGSSGGGNHFVEFGIVRITDPLNEFQLPAGDYVAVLSHSGSRGLGANIARHYTKVAMDQCLLPREARHLAWLDLNTEAGEEYWRAMNLAGDYASACHHQIHERLAAALGETPLARIENHHNFAWREKDGAGDEIIVHRKGATPAGKGVLGIIPGSMATPGFIVRGKGEPASINSAAHGAGRTMSRTKAKQSILPGQVNKILKEAGVELIGSGLDEAPMAYKNIHQVMSYQDDLVEVVGSFMPKIVRMCGDERFKEVD